MPLAASSCNAAHRRSSTMVHSQELRAAVTLCLATSSCNPACQERRNITHSRLQTRIAGASHQMDQWGLDCTNPALVCAPHFCVFFSCEIELPHAPTTVLYKFCKFCRPHLPKVVRTPQFFDILKRKETLLSWPQKPHYPNKTQGFAPECFHPWILTLPNCCTSQLLDDGWWTWWCGWHDGGNADHDNRP